jgi:hypothetical protein
LWYSFKVFLRRQPCLPRAFIASLKKGVQESEMLIREERKTRLKTAIMVLILSGIIGNLFGVFLGAVLPEGSLHDTLSKSKSFGLDPPVSLDLWIVSLSIGFNVKLNICGLLFMFVGLILYKKA